MLNQLSDIENCFVPTIKGHFQLAMANMAIFQINSRCSNGPIGASIIFPFCGPDESGDGIWFATRLIEYTQHFLYLLFIVIVLYEAILNGCYGFLLLVGWLKSSPETNVSGTISIDNEHKNI
ncbi:hypothetical protein BLOT_001421 [Blomia tropicalis]|nr:hypothetical protein BLOT_001421 [Blomia tropicalis]